MKLLKHPWVITLLCVLFVIIVALISLTISANRLAKSEFIAPNTWVGQVRMDDMNKLGATNAIQSHYGNFFQGKTIYLQYGIVSKSIPLDSFIENMLVEQMVNTALENGKTGNWFHRVWETAKRPFVRTYLPLQYTFSAKIFDEIEEFADAVDMQYNTYTIDENAGTLTVNRETIEHMIDVDATAKSLFSALNSGTPDKIKTVSVGKSSRNIAKLIHSRLVREPVDATVTSEDNQIVFVKEKNGIDFNTTELRKALSSGEKNVTIHITVTPAEITEDKLRAQLFTDVLAEYTTKYAMDGSRSKNIQTASNSINGTLLLPGQSFSFNGTVGERTFAAGFAMAHVYSGGQIIDGVGGGICQVSTTLYSAVLLADLEVVERHNHSFTISYAPTGQDATVAYNALDFVFKNNTEYPIKIETINGYGTLTVRILGTNIDPEKEIQLVHTTISTKAFPVVEKPNPDVNSTKRVVEQAGMTGYTVDSYKIYKRNGIEENRVFLHRSVYQTLPQIVLIPQAAIPPIEVTPSPLLPTGDEIL